MIGTKTVVRVGLEECRVVRDGGHGGMGKERRQCRSTKVDCSCRLTP